MQEQAVATSPGGARGKRSGSDWSLADAKAKFDEIARRARSGPQYVRVGGRRTVAVVEAKELDRLLSLEAGAPLVEFLESLHVPGLDLERDLDPGRDVAL